MNGEYGHGTPENVVEKKSEAPHEFLDDMDRKMFTQSFRVLKEWLEKEKRESVMPDELLFVDTMARPMYWAVEPIIDKLYQRGQHPKIHFIAPSRQIGKDGEPVFQELFLRSLLDSQTYEEARQRALRMIDAEREVEIKGLETYGEKYDRPETKSFVEKNRRNISEKSEKKKESFLQLSIEMMEPVHSALNAHIEKIIQHRKKILVIDDYITRGQTALQFAVFAKMHPELAMNFFGAVRNVYQSRNFSLLPEDLPSNFHLFSGVEWNSGLVDPNYSVGLWKSLERKFSSIGVMKDHMKPVATLSTIYNPAYIKKIRSEMREIGRLAVEEE